MSGYKFDPVVPDIKTRTALEQILRQSNTIAKEMQDKLDALNKQALDIYTRLHKDDLSEITNRNTAVETRKPYHGVESRGVLSFNNTTHVLTIATSIIYWYKGTKIRINNSVTCDADSYITLTADTLYYFYFDDITGTLKCSTSFWDLHEIVPVAMVYWNGTAGAIQNESHSHTRDIDWHINAHLTIGAKYYSGFDKTKPTTLDDALLQIEVGVMYDEDLATTTTQQTVSRIWYIGSTGRYTWVDSALPYAGSSGQPQYNRTSDNTLQNVASAKFCVMWYYASNDIDRPIYIFPHQGTSDYNVIADARNATPPAHSGLTLNPEIKLLYKVIYKGDGEFQEFVDYRNSSSLPAGGTAATAASSVSFIPYGTIASTTVQTAIQEVVDELPVKATGAEINTGTDDDKFATPKAIADSDIAFLTDIPAVATGAEVNTGSDNTKYISPKAIEDSDYAKTSAIPVKASAAEITAGTDDAKFATALAIAGSSIVKLKRTYKEINVDDYTVLDDDGYEIFNFGTGASDRTLTLPTYADNIGRVIKVIKTDSGSGGVIVDGEGAETIDGETTYTLTGQYDYVVIVAQAGEWIVTSRSYSSSGGGVMYYKKVFIASGTWSHPDAGTAIDIQVTLLSPGGSGGAGGAGGTGDGGTKYGGSGGGGGGGLDGYFKRYFASQAQDLAITIDTTKSEVTGTGFTTQTANANTSGSNGSAGTNSGAGSGAGGVGGKGFLDGADGIGGSATTKSGSGGSTPSAKGAVYVVVDTVGNAGEAATKPGGGGGGGSGGGGRITASAPKAGGAGGAGAAGYVIIEWWV